SRLLYPYHSRLLFFSLDFFFFQAEDGIRDRNVTGVQTCALPSLEINIIDPYGNYLLVDQTTGEYTIDGLIRDAMKNIDSNEYYYQAVDVYEGIMMSSYYFGAYQIIDVYVGSISYDSIPEELPEDVDHINEPEIPGYEEPIFEDNSNDDEQPSTDFDTEVIGEETDNIKNPEQIDLI